MLCPSEDPRPRRQRHEPPDPLRDDHFRRCTDTDRPPRVDEGLAHAGRALALYHQAGDPDDVLMALGVLVDYHALLGDAELAGRYADRAAAIGRRVTAPEMRAMTWAMQGRVHQAREELTEAIASYQSALSALPGFTPAWARYQAEYLAEIARSYQELGDVSLARESWTAALDLLRRAGHPLAAQVRSELGTLPGSSADRP